MLVVANTINIAADIGAMADAARLLTGTNSTLFVVFFGAACVLGQVFFSYEKSVRILKWLTLALFSYVAVVLMAKVPVRQLLVESFQPWRYLPGGTSPSDYATILVAILGTTISPYLFFWQAAGSRGPSPARRGLHRRTTVTAQSSPGCIEVDLPGMLLSNGRHVHFFTTAVALHAGSTAIATTTQAAEALRPIAGDFAFSLFTLGIIGTGLLADTVLAGSAAYAVSEVFGWKAGPSHGLQEARGFYLIIAAATGIGTLMSVAELDPIKALVWSAIVNGVISVPIMVVMLYIGQSRRIMGEFTMSRRHRVFAWAAAALMAVAVTVMFVTA